MKRWGFVLLCACRQDISLNEVEARLAVPTPLVDLATRVGEPLAFVVELEHVRGDAVELLDVDVVNVQGSAFRYLGEVDLTLQASEILELPFVYEPDQAGFDAGALFLKTNAVDGDFQITARGRASVPAVEVFPAAVDFGPVVTSATVSVRVDNRGPTAVTVQASASDPRFTLVAASVPIEAGAFATIPVTYAPLGSERVTAQVTLAIGAEVVGTVQLRANDCGHGDPGLYDADGDGVTACAGDCDDQDAGVRPGAAEVIDGRDQDCDGSVDEATAATDDDGDGFCEGSTCVGTALPGDCDDSDAARFPDAPELDGNGLDDDCDGEVDAGSTDGDGDGASEPADCDDTLASVGPGAPELLDGVDNDCDGVIDEGTAAFDDDGDGYCEGATCVGGALPGDCNDGAAGDHPDALELPDFVDNDCDGAIDEGTVNDDADGDGFTPAGGDCNDEDPQINPATGTC